MQGGPVTNHVHVWLVTWLAVNSSCTVDGDVQIDFDRDLLRLNMKLSCAAAEELAEKCACDKGSMQSCDKGSMQELPCKASTDVVVQ